MACVHRPSSGPSSGVPSSSVAGPSSGPSSLSWHSPSGLSSPNSSCSFSVSLPETLVISLFKSTNHNLTGFRPNNFHSVRCHRLCCCLLLFHWRLPSHFPCPGLRGLLPDSFVLEILFQQKAKKRLMSSRNAKSPSKSRTSTLLCCLISCILAFFERILFTLFVVHCLYCRST